MSKQKTVSKKSSKQQAPKKVHYIKAPAMPPKAHPFTLMKPDHVITPTFKLGQMQYWQLHDTFNVPSHRMMAAIHVYDEWQNRTTNEVLRAFIDAFKQGINSNPINITGISDVLNKLEERLNWPIPTREIMIKMASILHFDESESPYDYDDAYNNEVKIPFWKSQRIDNFFLYKHLKESIPLPSISPAVLEGAMITIGAMDNLHLKKLGIHSQNVS